MKSSLGSCSELLDRVQYTQFQTCQTMYYKNIQLGDKHMIIRGDFKLGKFTGSEGRDPGGRVSVLRQTGDGGGVGALLVHTYASTGQRSTNKDFPGPLFTLHVDSLVKVPNLFGLPRFPRHLIALAYVSRFIKLFIRGCPIHPERSIEGGMVSELRADSAGLHASLE